MIFVLSSFSTLPSPPGGLSDYHDAHWPRTQDSAVLTARALGKGLRDISWRAVLGAIVIATLYGMSDEYHQLFVPGRSFDHARSRSRCRWLGRGRERRQERGV